MKKIVVSFLAFVFLAAGCAFTSSQPAYEKLSSQDKAVYLATQELNKEKLLGRKFVSAAIVSGNPNIWKVYFNDYPTTDTEVYITVNIETKQVIKVERGLG